MAGATRPLPHEENMAREDISKFLNSLAPWAAILATLGVFILGSWANQINGELKTLRAEIKAVETETRMALNRETNRLDQTINRVDQTHQRQYSQILEQLSRLQTKTDRLIEGIARLEGEARKQ